MYNNNEKMPGSMIRRNPPAPPGMSMKGLTKIVFYKPETNPIVKMMNEEKAAQSETQSIVHLLDQFLLQTPPVSEDEEESAKEPMEVVSPNKLEKAEPARARGIAMDDSITKKILEFVEEEKRKKLSQHHKSSEREKKKREGKYEREEKRKASDTSERSVSVQKKYHKSSAKESLIADDSGSSSPTIVGAFSLARSKSPPSRSSRRSKSPPNRPSNRSISPSNRSSRRSKSPPNRSSQRSKSPSNRSSKHIKTVVQKNFVAGDEEERQERRSGYRSSRRDRSSSRSPDGRSHNRHCSPDGRSHNRYRSPVGSSTRSKYENRPQRESSKRYSPDRNPSRDKPPYHKPLVPYEKSPPRERGSHSPDSERHTVVRRPEKESLDKFKRTAAAKPKFKNFAVKDEYSQILAEEMKKRQLLEEDSDEDSAVGGMLEAPVKKEIVVPEEEDSAPLSRDQEDLVKYELGIVNPKEMRTTKSFPQTKFFKQEDNKSQIKSEFPENTDGAILNSYYCQPCQLGLNSDLTWHSHISGKKHARMLQLQKVHEIARGSISMPPPPVFASEEAPRFANAPPGKIRFPIPEMPRLLPAIDELVDRPIPGLDFIQEIISENDVNYYCELCDAPCGPSSILPHLIGYKHQLKSLKQIDPVFYDRNKHISSEKRRFGSILQNRLLMHEQRFGRGRIKVLMENVDPTPRPPPAYDQPGPSWRNTSSIPVLKKEKREREDGEIDIPPNEECLDTSKGDFFCKLCDSHMNNINMWEAHVRGKRHLKNAKKVPGENISKLKSVKAPRGTRSHLEALLNESARDELIVGLDFIRETQGVNGELYNCFLCGSCCTNYDIKDHILLPKHRLKFLEKLVTEGKPNDVTCISQMEFQDPWFRQTLVDNECRRMVELYGKGHVEVYLSKN